MEDKIKELELLIERLVKRLENSEKERNTLRHRMLHLENAVKNLRASADEAKDLRNWKKETINKLKKLDTLLEKEIEDQHKKITRI